MQIGPIIEAMVKSDPTVPEQLKAFLAARDQEGAPRANVRPITTQQSCEIIKVHPVTLRRYAKLGLLHPIRHTARRIRWDRNEIERFACEGVATENTRITS
jgi:hypothetical protein